MRALTVSAFRKNLKKHLDAVIDDQDIIVIPRDNGDGDGEGIVVMPLSQYKPVSETDHLLATRANREALEESRAQARRGDLIGYEGIEKLTEAPAEQ